MPVLQAAPTRSAPPPPGAPQNMRGIALMALGFFAFAACDVQAKYLTDSFSAVQVVWFRQIGLFVGVLVLLALRGPRLLRSRLPFLQIARGLTAVASAICFVVGVTYVPLADAVAVTFIAPFVVTVLGALFLREPVGPRRWAAVAVGFVGMLIVIRPGLGVFHPAIGFIVAAAILFSLRQVLSRGLSGMDPVTTTVAFTSLTATLTLSAILPVFWSWPQDAALWLPIIGLALTAAIGEVLVIRALDIAQAVVLAPVHYSLILWGTLYGFMVFGELPDGWTLVGCAVIVLSGLYTLHRERLNARKAQASASNTAAPSSPSSQE